MMTETDITSPYRTSASPSRQFQSTDVSRVHELWKKHVVNWREEHRRYEFYNWDEQAQIMVDRDSALSELSAFIKSDTTPTTAFRSSSDDLIVGRNSGACTPRATSSGLASTDRTPTTFNSSARTSDPLTSYLDQRYDPIELAERLSAYIKATTDGDYYGARTDTGDTSYYNYYAEGVVFVHDPSLQSINSRMKSTRPEHDTDYSAWSITELHSRAKEGIRLVNENPVVSCEFETNSVAPRIWKGLSTDYGRWVVSKNETEETRLKNELIEVNRDLDIVINGLFSFKNESRPVRLFPKLGPAI